MINNIRPLTQEQRQAARKAAALANLLIRRKPLRSLGKSKRWFFRPTRHPRRKLSQKADRQTLIFTAGDPIFVLRCDQVASWIDPEKCVDCEAHD